MSDWPADRYHKPVISTLAVESLGVQIASRGTSVPTAAVWPTANLAYYIPFTLAAPFLVKKVFWANGTVGGNIDVGVYSADPGTPVRLFSSGATAMSGATAVQSVTISTATLLGPGSYYFAMSSSVNTNQTLYRSTNAVRDVQVWGCAQQATAHPLPATATLATMATGVVPLCGITSGTVI